MTISPWKESDSKRAEVIWSEYQQKHDISAMQGKTVGIDPTSGLIWIGDSIQDVVGQRDAGGSSASLFFLRVGSKTYYRKGGHR